MNKCILTAAIGETVTWIDWGRRRTDTVAARQGGVTITRDEAGQLSAWTAAGPHDRRYPQSTGWIFGSDATPESAIARVIGAENGWAGLARGEAEAGRWE